MNKQPRLDVAFGEPSAGWLAVEIRTAEQCVHENFSHIYPTLPDLCSALCDALGGRPSRLVTFLLEPAELELTIVPEGPTVSVLSLRMFRDRSRTLTPAPALEFHGAATAIVLAFWRALRRLQTCLPASQFSERYRQPFPELEMESLTRLVTAQKEQVDR
ncbi:uncharacterized protein SOCEGT47_017050 [Sorangium cellulosum]|uniref:Uncharacterized protein n=1 Tax=Sorangium cellulosum TaxID=56 RepID=A0A4P2PWI9_SORCE|nr:hypothetical protein [Sorangium cellulosum]AUX21225.1 uncharacterized protein SOCEGT47_017050 [Sorangium cellulosum]